MTAFAPRLGIPGDEGAVCFVSRAPSRFARASWMQRHLMKLGGPTFVLVSSGFVCGFNARHSK